MKLYKLEDKYLTNDRSEIESIMSRYVVFLLDGFTINGIKILVDTIKGYMGEVNKHYDVQGYNKPFHIKADSKAALLLREQAKFEDEPARRSPLNIKMIVKMYELSKEDPLSFAACIYDFSGSGCFGGFREQEFAMESKTKIRYFIKPDGTKVIRAFTRRNFIFYDSDGARISDILSSREDAADIGHRYEVQKNRMNGQVIKYHRVPNYPQYCAVELGISIVERAHNLGQGLDDPLCVYQDSKGRKRYLTGTDVTKYYRFIAQLVTPNISSEELKLISTHSIRVTACVLLNEAGKDGSYIKLRLRWLSNCFEVYLRNTDTITAQHNEALSDVHQRMAALAVSTANANADAVHVSGSIDPTMNDLEDDD